MNTDRTLDPSRQENINATRRIDTGSATIRANASTLRPASATVRSSAMMGGAFKPDSLEVQNDNVDDKFFLLKGNKYKNIQSLSENTGEAQVFLVERDGENYVLKIYYPNFDVNKKVLQTVYNFDFEMIVKVYDFGKTYVDIVLMAIWTSFAESPFRELLHWPTVISIILCTRISNQATSSSVTKSIRNWCLVILVSPASWIRMEKPIRQHKLVRLSMLHLRCTLM